MLKKYDHIWLYAPIFVTVFDFLEKLISPESNYWVSYTPIDDLIPFNELFVIPYVIWFPYIFLIGAFLFFAHLDCKKLRKKSLIIIAAVLSVLTTLSTVFIKQHSFLDVVWGLIWSVVLYFIVYVWMKSAMERKKEEAGKA